MKETLLKWIDTLRHLILFDEENKKNYLEELNKVYDKTYKIDDSDVDLLISWGKVLRDLSSSLEGKEYGLLRKSLTKFELANKIDSNNSELLLEWAKSIGDFALLEKLEYTEVIKYKDLAISKLEMVNI